ncbi:MAG: hypothetical protein E7192_00530 [Erysipelotrichaceae bacterium]|nr:hypothetical protein [Erysipelotrichaceae bacterium]
MLKKSLILSLLAMLMVSGLSVFNTSVNADEKVGCVVLEDGTIVCKEDLAEGCRINVELSIVECDVDPLGDHDDKFPKG